MARGALIRAGVKWLDINSCPVNPDGIPTEEDINESAKHAPSRLDVASVSFLGISWLLFTAGVIAALIAWLTTTEIGPERELAAVITFGLFGWPAFIVGAIEFIFGLVVIRDVGRGWTIVNLLNPIVILAMPFILATILGLGPG